MTCFFTVYDERARDMATGMINSVKHWYPDIPMEALEIDKRNTAGGFDLQGFCHDILTHGLKLLDKYDRIIYIDPDSVMCNACPDLFDDYKLGCVLNNTICGPEYGGTKDQDYVNAGLVVCTDKQVWKMILDEYEKRNNEVWSTLNHQNALNFVYHNIEAKLLEFPDKTYGISSLAHYQDMELRQRGDIMLTEPQYELWLPSNKKLCVFHAAGVYWKTGTKINYDYIKNEDARNLLVSYTHA
jgi:lipopolysaccharide biosynthesis glycosyltransferase